MDLVSDLINSGASCCCKWPSLEFRVCSSTYLGYQPNVLEVSRVGNTPTNPANRRRKSRSAQFGRTHQHTVGPSSSIRKVKLLGDTPPTTPVDQTSPLGAGGKRNREKFSHSHCVNGYEVERPLSLLLESGDTLFEQGDRTNRSANHLQRSWDQLTFASSEISLEQRTLGWANWCTTSRLRVTHAWIQIFRSVTHVIARILSWISPLPLLRCRRTRVPGDCFRCAMSEWKQSKRNGH